MFVNTEFVLPKIKIDIFFTTANLGKSIMFVEEITLVLARVHNKKY